MRRIVLCLAVAATWGLAGPFSTVRAGDPAPAPRVGEIPLTDGLILTGPVGSAARWPVHTDPVEARIVAGAWAPPKAGDEVTLLDGTKRAWAKVAAGPDGTFPADALKPGTYVSFVVPSDSERVMLLHAVGDDFVYVNGELRPGDVYSYGWLRLPVLLKKGDNSFLFRASAARGHGLQATLVPPPADVFVSPDDMTLPDDIGPPPQGEFPPRSREGAVVVVNATTAAVGNVYTGVRPVKGGVRGRGDGPKVAPLTLRKLAIDLADVESHAEVSADIHAAPAAASWMPLAISKKDPAEPHVRTYRSGIDWSVQYYAVIPARPRPEEPPIGRAGPSAGPALVLSLHGASVEARGLLGVYDPKTWATIVCPTNRRPFGFDWEDWGRDDTIQVLGMAEWAFRHDPARVFVTGHSMGGHGTWQMGVTYPDRFAAIGPSAAWISFSSYAGAPGSDPKDDVDRMLRRAASPSDTLALASNLAQLGVYILHGDADPEVPVTEARTMAEVLKGFHHDWTLFEQKGAVHWWDVNDEPGVDCMDWPPMFDFFARHAIPPEESVRDLDFVTADPGISASCRWATIDAQRHSRGLSRIRLHCDPGKRLIRGTTENVARLFLRAGTVLAPDAPLDLDLDGTRIAAVPWPAEGGVLRLGREGDHWSVVGRPEATVKTAARCGPFKAAFDNHFMLVYGTKGTPEENAWALAKARYDAEAWYYRANGSVDIFTDDEWVAGPRGEISFEFDRPVTPEELLRGDLPPSKRVRSDKHHSVILYGNADTNAAWDPLLKGSPVVVRRGSLKVGAKELKGDDLACLFIRPKPGSDVASVGVVSGTGLPGMRLCDRMPYFTSGIHFPDVTVFRADMLSKGSEGVRGTGFFGPDWSIESGDFAWRD